MQVLGRWGGGEAGRLEGGQPRLLGSCAQDPSGLMICLGELIAAALSGGSISSLCKQGRQIFSLNYPGKENVVCLWLNKSVVLQLGDSIFGLDSQGQSPPKYLLE